MVYVPSGLFCLVGGRGGVEKSTSPGAERFGGCCASPHTALNLAPTPKGTGGKGERNFITLGGGERVRYFGEYGKQKKEKKEKKKREKGQSAKRASFRQAKQDYLTTNYILCSVYMYIE